MPHPPLSWSAWAEAVAAALRGLVDGQTYAVSAPASLARPAKRPGVAKRLTGRRYVRVAPWVSFVRLEDHLLGSCISDDRSIGFPLSAQEKELLVALGWHEPSPGQGPTYFRWFPDDVAETAYLALADADRAADLAGLTMRDVFGVSDPADLVIA